MAGAEAQNGHTSFTNYVSYRDTHTGRERIGHYDLEKNTIYPLTFVSGTPIDNLYQVIEAGEAYVVSDGTSEALPVSSTKILPPFTGRDILCVGKNYAAHAKEFNSSGFDSSDKVDTPSHPVIFTKRFTSIIANGEDIYPHPGFTDTVDYEGEIGVIIGKPGFRIEETEAMNHVWGYTIINDMTARERQRDHKQFYIGKSPDTFCPMGPIAVPAHALDKVLRVQTHVNGELRQDATTEDLIFSIPFLIKTMSEGQTLMPGDVLATGTPAGVGIGRKPPVYLKSGDTVTVSVNGLGTLTNRIGETKSMNPTLEQLSTNSRLPQTNTSRSIDSSTLTQINNKPLFYKAFGFSSGPPIVFVHGLGGSAEFFTPLIQYLGLEKSNSLYSFDLEGHGLSPTSPLAKLTIGSFAADVNGVFEKANISDGATIIAHSLGSLVAVKFALQHPDKVAKLILLGPPPSPLPEAGVNATYTRAKTVRKNGMAGIVDAVANAGTSEKSKTTVALAAVRMSLLSQDPEGYAKACTALASADGLDFAAIRARTLIVTGSDDKTSPPQLCETYAEQMQGNADLHILQDVGHWHVFEDTQGVAKAIESFLA